MSGSTFIYFIYAMPLVVFLRIALCVHIGTSDVIKTSKVGGNSTQLRKLQIQTLQCHRHKWFNLNLKYHTNPIRLPSNAPGLSDSYSLRRHQIRNKNIPYLHGPINFTKFNLSKVNKQRKHGEASLYRRCQIASGK